MVKSINYGNTSYRSIEHFNKYSISMKKIYADLKKAHDSGNFIWEQRIKRDLGIIKRIRLIQEEFNLKILNYYCQGCAEYAFIETLEGEKYVLDVNLGKLQKDSSWKVNNY